MKVLTYENLNFLLTIAENTSEVLKGFQAAMLLTDKEAVEFIKSQLPTKDSLSKTTLRCYTDRKELYEDPGDYDEICDVAEIWFGSRMWYLEVDSVGFHWIGNALYSEDEWDNESLIEIPWNKFDDLDYVAKKIYKDFKESGCPRDNWNKIQN